jgi:hypothetical protein
MRRHLVWFPFLLIALTVILALTIVFVDKSRGELAESVGAFKEAENSITQESIDPALYRGAVAEVLLPIWPILDFGVGEVAVVKGVRDSVLELKVSQQDRDTHILIVVALNKLVVGVGGDDVILADATIRLNELSIANTWLKTEN